MAVNLMSAPTAINNPSNRYNFHQDYQSLTPSTSNSNTPSTISPTSPRTASTSTSTSPGRYPHSSRQIKPPKTPLYIPAVLRPTENPSRHRPCKSISTDSVSRILASSSASPITPPSSADSSWDSREGQKDMEDTIQARLMASEGITRVVTDEWNDDNFEDVTGAPTRDHWKPDSTSPTCDAPICDVNFTLLRRRHHCRRCGNIFCATHSINAVPLDQHARFHPDGAYARACDNCMNDFRAWRRRRGERGSGSGSSGYGSGVATPIPGFAGTGADRGTRSLNSRDGVATFSGAKKGKDVIVGSLPRDWNWSTF